MKVRLLVRYGELSTKGRNKKMFTQKLANNIKKALMNYPQVRVFPDYDFMYLDLNGVPKEDITKTNLWYSVIFSCLYFRKRDGESERSRIGLSWKRKSEW